MCSVLLDLIDADTSVVFLHIHRMSEMATLHMTIFVGY